MEQSVQSNNETYIDIMLQSLKKKIAVLDVIEVQNEKQKEILEDPASTIESFDETVDAKSNCIEQLEQLDSGFDKLFSRVEEMLKENKEQYRDQIAMMQEYIRIITDKSMDLQKQEARNKELMTARFATVKKQAKSVRANAAATSQYYKSMMSSDYIDPQFMDNKK